VTSRTIESFLAPVLRKATPVHHVPGVSGRGEGDVLAMARSATKTAEVIAIGGDVPTNGGAETILSGEPYIATVRITGTADYLFHAWNVEAVAAKASAAKGSKAKKSDDLESYVYRDDDGYLAIPGEQLRMSIVNAARYQQDPRSPRKSAMDLFKASLVVLTARARVLPNTKEWHYEHKCRVVVQRNAITRTRPALKTGWSAEWDIQVLQPEYVPPSLLNETVTKAGIFCCLGDFRPTYGRFILTKFDIRLG
jgi:hypothetical protein